MEHKEIFVYTDLLKWINLLMAPGSSLGGARPKASVQDVNGELWIAKFPSKDDLIDSGAWEMVANEMAHFSSAMTMLGYSDGASAADGVSYLEIAEFIILNGANVDADLSELFKRIVYDVNPNHYRGGLKLNISENDNSQDFSLALSVAPFFRLSSNEAEKIINYIKKVVCDWRIFATKYKIPKGEQDLMSKAFLYS